MSQPSVSPVRARFAWISPQQTAPDAELSDALRRAGYRLHAPGATLKAELALIDLRHTLITGALTRQLSTEGRAAAPHGDIIFLADANIDAVSRAHLRKSGTYILYDNTPQPLIAHLRETLRNLRFQEEAGERLKSLTAADALAPLKPLKYKDGGRILFSGVPSPEALEAINAVQKEGFEIETAMTPAQTVAAINSRPYACAIFSPSAPSDPLKSIAAAIRRKRSLSAMPVVFIDDTQPASSSHLIKEQIEKDLGAVIHRAIKTARQKRLLRQIFNNRRHASIIDPHTNTYSAPFFARHAARLFARAEETDRPLSFALFKIGLPGFLGDTAEQRLAPMKEAAELISRACRQEDLLARLAPDAFVLTLPNVTEEDGVRIVERTTAVLKTTMFENPNTDVGTDEKIFGLSVNAHTIVREQGTCVEQIVAKLLAQTTAEYDTDASLAAYPWA